MRIIVEYTRRMDYIGTIATSVLGRMRRYSKKIHKTHLSRRYIDPYNKPTPWQTLIPTENHLEPEPLKHLSPKPSRESIWVVVKIRVAFWVP